MLLSVFVTLTAPIYAFDLEAVMDRALPARVGSWYPSDAGYRLSEFMIGFGTGAHGVAALMAYHTTPVTLLDGSSRGLRNRQVELATNRASALTRTEVPEFGPPYKARVEYARSLASKEGLTSSDLAALRRKLAAESQGNLPTDGLEIWERRFKEQLKDPQIAKTARKQIRLARLGVGAYFLIPIYTGLSLVTRENLPGDRTGGAFPLPSLATEMLKEVYSDLEPHLPSINVSFESGE